MNDLVKQNTLGTWGPKYMQSIKDTKLTIKIRN